MHISLKCALKLRKESALTIGKSLALILYLARRYGGAKVKDTSIKLPAWRLRRVTDFIDTHLSSTIRIAELADLAELSPRVQGDDRLDAAGVPSCAST
jgi:transcriptional regulator GlxA family with amidase domain